MKTKHLIILLFTLAICSFLLLSTPDTSNAQSCGTGYAVRQTYYQPYVAPAYVAPVQTYQYNYPVLAATFVPIPLVYPTYNVQYQGDGSGIAQLRNELKALRGEIQQLRTVPQVQLQQPQALPLQQSPQPIQQPNTQPLQGQLQPNNSQSPQQPQQLTLGFDTILLQKCSNCHDATVAKSKGSSHTFFQDGKIVMTPVQALKSIGEIYAGRMPKAPNKTLSDQEVAVVVSGLAK